MPAFPTEYSILSARALAERVEEEYDLGQVQQCRFYSSGFNDTYQLRTRAGQTCYLRVYRRAWRRLSDIRYELDVLTHLEQAGCPAVRVVPGRAGNLWFTLPAPEGERVVVLFREAPGAPVSFRDEPEATARSYGQAVGRIHRCMQGFTSPHERVSLDLPALLTAPLGYLQPYLADQPEAWEFLQRFVALLLERIQALPESALEQGFCHGDFQGGHANVDPHGTFTFYDFDCCGRGYLAYDLAVFRWQLEADELVRWQPFVQGYREVRPFPEIDLAAVPYFVAARRVWHMGVHAQNTPDWGCGFLGREYFERRLKDLRTLGEEQLSIRT